MSDPTPTFDLVEPHAAGNPLPGASVRRRMETRRLPENLDFAKAARYFHLEEGLRTAINMALCTGCPLLVTGEPGTGKTQVAYFVAGYFDIPLFEYHTKSTATAQSLAYEFDTVRYFREAQTRAKDAPLDRMEFLQRRALWLAYEHAGPSVVLIDEIDKAPRDFPNDLLLELNQHEFTHPFEARKIAAPKDQPPFVVITSNAERRLPDAFLRRCIVHHLEIDEDLIDKIVRARTHSDFPRLDALVLKVAVRRFFELREAELEKPPATGELLAWLTLLNVRGASEKELARGPLAKLPFLGALVKLHEDLQKLETK